MGKIHKRIQKLDGLYVAYGEENVLKAIEKIDDRNKAVLCMYFGLKGVEKTDVSEISKKFTTIEKAKIVSRVENGNAVMEFDAKDYMTYEFVYDDKVIAAVSGKSGKQTTIIPLSLSKQKIEIRNYYTNNSLLFAKQEISFLKKSKATKDKWYI